MCFDSAQWSYWSHLIHHKSNQNLEILKLQNIQIYVYLDVKRMHYLDRIQMDPQIMFYSSKSP